LNPHFKDKVALRALFLPSVAGVQMRFFDPSPEGRTRFLRKHFKASLKKRAQEVLGKDGLSILEEMRACRSESDDLESWARLIFRKCMRLKMPERIAYVRACIRADKRVSELIDWEMNNPDPLDNLTAEEIYELTAKDHQEQEVYYRTAWRVETELAVRLDGGGAIRLLKGVVGRKRAMELGMKLMGAVGQSEAERIMLRACEPDVRNPEKYLAAVIRNSVDD
jgi:hypothetical protein